MAEAEDFFDEVFVLLRDGSEPYLLYGQSPEQVAKQAIRWFREELRRYFEEGVNEFQFIDVSELNPGIVPYLEKPSR